MQEGDMKEKGKADTTITPKRFVAILEKTADTMRKLTFSKGAEYKQGSTDQLANFKRNATRAKVHPLTIWRLYFDKHYDSIMGWLDDQVGAETKEYSEPIIGRIDDAILYLHLLKGFYYERHPSELESAREEACGALDEMSLDKREMLNRALIAAPRFTLCDARRAEIFEAIEKERKFQDQKYGSVLTMHMNQGPGGHELPGWTLVAEKELEEAKDAAVHGGSKQIKGRNSVRQELVQVAAVCVAALEQHGLAEE